MKKIVALILAIAVLVGGWWYASPLMALDGLRDAAEAGDTAELEERVDFPRLRQSFKEQLSTALADAAGGDDADPLVSAGASLGMMVIDPIVDGLVTPDTVAKAVTEGRVVGDRARAARDALPSPETAAPEAEMSYDIERNGLSTFRVTTTNARGAAGPILLFERDGLGWDLVGIEMSPSELIP